MSRNISVGIAAGYELNHRGSIPGKGKKFLSFPVSRPALESTFISTGHRRLFPGVKRLGREADHSLSSSTEVKNCGAVLPNPHRFSWRSA
jgi:hypothetical protein